MKGVPPLKGSIEFFLFFCLTVTQLQSYVKNYVYECKYTSSKFLKVCFPVFRAQIKLFKRDQTNAETTSEARSLKC